MEDDFALFDPLQPAPAPGPGPSPAPAQEKVRAGGGAGRDTSVVLEDWDLLGGGQEVSQEVRPGDNSSPAAGAGSHASAAARSTTSFFLLDLDTSDGGEGGGGAATLAAAVTGDHRADSAADSIDDDLSVASEVLSVAGDTLPLDTAGSDAQEAAAAPDQPQSGFFFQSLLESDVPRGTQRTLARDTVPGVDSDSGDSAGGGPKFHIGSTVQSRDEAAADPAPAEAGLPSLLDVDLPPPSVRPHLVTREAAETEVEVFTAEDAEDDSVDGCVISANPVMDTAEYKQLEDQLDNPSCGPQLEEPSYGPQLEEPGYSDQLEEPGYSDQLEEPGYSEQLSEQLRPVFEMCVPNKEGLISIQHLQDMCRENGQVR